jgi:hypothetical protein
MVVAKELQVELNVEGVPATLDISPARTAAAAVLLATASPLAAYAKILGTEACAITSACVDVKWRPDGGFLVLEVSYCRPGNSA